MQDGSDMESRKRQRTCVRVAKKKDNNKQKDSKDGDASSSVTKQDGENSISTEGASTMTVTPVLGETCTVLQSEKENSLAVQITKEGGKTSEIGDVKNVDSDSGKIEVMSQLADTGQTSGAGLTGDTLHQGIPACEKNLAVEMDSESVKEDEATRLITDNSKIVNGGPPRGTVVEESVQNENNESRTDELQVINIEDKVESKKFLQLERKLYQFPDRFPQSITVRMNHLQLPSLWTIHQNRKQLTN
ncbi:hypothetical protein BSL78_13548 [Apostichopus japonicus]|uniref:Uncharacterized protein n=1 Tax=Stichopus japonicus TaxID=307972 RepID=A0A2G8KNP4_STIJA|nr:hypothetical protein BSL78_13548 [Apostichopus japonicus]